MAAAAAAAAATTFMSVSPPLLSSSLILKPKHQISSSSPLNLIAFRRPSTTNSSSSQYPPPSAALPNGKRWKLSAFRGNLFLLDATPVEDNAQEIVSASNGDSSSIIAVLILVAFAGLSILSIGVIYMGVTDFLQKREKEKFEKEESATKKKSGNKGKIRTRARAGPRGFGQKIEEDVDDATE